MNRSNKTQLVNPLNNSANKTANKPQISIPPLSFPNASATFPTFQTTSIAYEHFPNRKDPQVTRDFKQNIQHGQIHTQTELSAPIEVPRDNQNQESVKVEEPVGDLRSLNTQNQGRQEEEMKDNNGSGCSAPINGCEAGEGTERTRVTNLSPALHSAMLACLEVSKAEIERKFFNDTHCILCGKHIKNQIKAHIRYHIEKRSHIEGGYSFCLRPNGQGLQVKCKYCSETFLQPTAELLRGHSQACTFKGTNLNNRSVDFMDDKRYEKLEKKFMSQISTLNNRLMNLETGLGTTDKKLEEVSKTQEAEKERLNTVEKGVEGVEENLKKVEKEVDNHENALVGLLNHLIRQGQFEKPKEPVTCSSIFDRLKPVNQTVKEKERDRARSRERVKRGSQGNVLSRLVTKEDRERGEKRWNLRSGDSSRERSRNTREARLLNSVGQGYQDRRLDRRHN